MAFQNGFAASLIINGKPQRELNESGDRTVRIPFGSEYAIRVKNKSNVRAYVSIDIDGTDVMGGKLLMRPGQTIDVERFVVDGDLLKGKRFKFVSAGHSDVQDPTSFENGLIRVKIEQEYVPWTYTTTYFNTNDNTTFKTNAYRHTGVEGSSILRSRGIGGAGGGAGSTTGAAQGGVTNCANTSHNNFYIGNAQPPSYGSVMDTEAVTSDAGATVEGSVSNQKFESTSEAFATYAPFFIELRMRGPKVEQPVRQTWYEFDLLGKRAKSVVPLSQINQVLMGQAALAIARAEVNGKTVSDITILADSVMVA